MTAYYLHGLGVINALGAGREAVLQGLCAGSTAGVTPWAEPVGERQLRAAQVRGPLPVISPAFAAYDSRNNRLLQAAVEQIRTEIDGAIGRFGADRIGVVLGTSTAGILEGERAFKIWAEQGALPAGYDYRQQEISSPSEYLRRALNLNGPAWTVSTACTSSAKAFASARRLLRLDMCDAVVVGGVDSLCGLTLNGFAALESVSKDICNPMSLNRDGITIGEAAAVFLLSREPGPARLLGVGESSDAYHISGPDPEGHGAELAMRQALTDAGVQAKDIDYLNLHGTGTRQNDLMESHAVARVFGEKLSCSSTKPLVGHTLGAAGATELAFCWLLVTAGEALPLPPHVWDGERDEALAPLALCGPGEAHRCRIAASSSFAFGGSNACLIVGSA